MLAEAAARSSRAPGALETEPERKAMAARMSVLKCILNKLKGVEINAVTASKIKRKLRTYTP